jgi:predicted metal-dependent phosphoesterase TrpH
VTVEADLHLHSVHSDGLLAPGEVVARAGRAGLSAMALTDHDTVSGVAAARAAAPPGLEVIGGVELSSQWRGREIHLLAYDVDPDDPALNEVLAGLRHERRVRAQKIVVRLNALGIPVTFEELEGNDGGTGTAGASSIGRPHIAAAIVRHGAARSFDEAFSSFLRHGRPAHVPRSGVPVERALALARARGLPLVVAHPALNLSMEQLEELLALGFDGVEVFHPQQNEATRQRLLALAQRLGVVPTGGSDHHGEGRRGAEPGGAGVALAAVERLRQHARDGGRTAERSR